VNGAERREQRSRTALSGATLALSRSSSLLLCSPCVLAPQTMLEEFDNAVEEGEGGYEKLQEEYDSLKSDLEKLNEIRIEKMSSRGGLNTANEQNEIMLVQRNSLIDAVVAQHGLKLPAGIADASDLSGAQFTTAMNMLQAKKAELEEGVR